MKLKDDFLTHDIDDTQYLVSAGADSFKGIVRCNKSAAFIVSCLKEDTTEDKIVDAMCDKYDAPREILAADVKDILNTLRKIDALDE